MKPPGTPQPPDPEPPVSRRRDWRNGIGITIVLVLLAVAVWLVMLSRFRRAALVLCITLFAVGLARLVLPEARMGPLAVRSRAFDSVFCVLLGGVLAYLVAIE